MLPRHFMVLLLTVITLLNRVGFAEEGCCSRHGGVAGCAGAKLLCKDGTLSPTCSCRDRSNANASKLPAQDGLALLKATPQEPKPYVTPVPRPKPTSSPDIVPPLQANKPYVTPAAQSETRTQGDAIPSQKPPEPLGTPIDDSAKDIGYFASDKKSEEAHEETPKSHPGEFQPIKATSAKKNSTTGEVWVRDKSAHGGNHWEVYKDQRAWEKGIRDRQVWSDGKTGKRY